MGLKKISTSFNSRIREIDDLPGVVDNSNFERVVFRRHFPLCSATLQ